MNKKHIYGLVIITFSALLFSSCREDIINPVNNGGNVNQPISQRTNFSYFFSIEAENMTTLIRDYTGLNTNHSNLLLSVDGYRQGRASLYIFDYSNRLLYQNVVTDNVEQISVRLDEISPDIVTINFINFSGNVKIQLYSN